MVYPHTTIRQIERQPFENAPFLYCFCAFISNKSSSCNCGPDSFQLEAMEPPIAVCTAPN